MNAETNAPNTAVSVEIVSRPHERAKAPSLSAVVTVNGSTVTTTGAGASLVPRCGEDVRVAWQVPWAERPLGMTVSAGPSAALGRVPCGSVPMPSSQRDLAAAEEEARFLKRRLRILQVSPAIPPHPLVPQTLHALG